MEKRYILVVLTFLVCGAVTGVSMQTLRKEIPFQEIVPLSGAIAVINGQQWHPRDLEISCTAEGGIAQKATYDEKGFCIFEGLSNEVRYRIRIRRTDIRGAILYRRLEAEITLPPSGSSYYVLVGASVGQAWGFDAIPRRLGLKASVICGNRTVYDFDKSRAIRELVDLPMPIGGVIIKECAAYFPREQTGSEKQIITWVDTLRDKGVNPILATVVPVTKEHDRAHPGRFDSIVGFNDFLRSFGLKEGIAVLDLEKALRTSDRDRHLLAEYADPDGLHLNARAYEKLDKIVRPILER